MNIYNKIASSINSTFLRAAFTAIAALSICACAQAAPTAGNAGEDPLTKPSIKDVLSDEAPSGPAPGEEPGMYERGLIGNLNVDELDEKIVIAWRGPKAGELLGLKIKARSAAVVEYHIFKSKNRKLNFTLTAKINANKTGSYKYEDFDLENNVVYYYKIMIADADGNLHPHIEQFSARARDVNRPKKPKRPEIESGDGFVKLHWTPYTAPDFDEYHVLRSIDLSNDHEIVARIRQNGLCQFVDTDVINGKTYGYMLRIKDKGGNLSRESDEMIGKPRDASPPAPPQDLKSTPGNNMIRLTWRRCEEKDVEFYKIYIFEGELKPRSKMTLIASIKANDSFFNSYDVKNLKNGKIYYFTVSAVDYSGNESAKAFEIKTSPVDFAPPAKPSYIKVSSMNAAARIEWASVPDADGDLAGYRIYRKSTAFPKFIAVTEVRKPKESQNQPFAEKRKKNRNNAREFYPTMYEHIDNGLYNGMAYTYYIVAFDNKGNESTASEYCDGIPRDKAAPKKIENLKAFSHIHKVELRWKKNASDRDLLGYYVYRRKDGEENYSTIAEIKKLPQNFFIDSNLMLGARYFYRVSAFDESRNESVASDEASAVARFTNQISFSRAYLKNYPYTYCYSFNPNDMSLCHTKSQDNISWSGWSEKIKLPSPPPNFGRMSRVSAQKWASGTLVFSYNPETLDLYFTSTPDEKNFGTWQLLFNRIELPPNFGKRCFLSFEKDETTVWAFAYNPLTGSAYYSISRDLTNFLGWVPCGLKVMPPPADNDFAEYFITSDEKSFFLFSFDLETANVMQSFCFDKKHWRAWYKFAKNMRKPPNLEKDTKLKTGSDL